MNATSEFKMNTELTAAVCAVMSEIKRLSKGDRNAHGGYQYTSVDDVKDGLRPLLAKHGLDLRITEQDWGLERLETKKGDISVAARFVFAITLRHNSGQEDIPERTTVLLPHTGAQTTGAARSYAIKEYLKSRFLVSTGEQDAADSSAQHEYGGTWSGKAGANADQAMRDNYATLMESMRSTKSEADYKGWKATYERSIAGLNETYFGQLQQAVREHKASWKAKTENGKTQMPFNDEVPF